MWWKYHGTKHITETDIYSIDYVSIVYSKNIQNIDNSKLFRRYNTRGPEIGDNWKENGSSQHFVGN